MTPPTKGHSMTRKHETWLLVPICIVLLSAMGCSGIEYAAPISQFDLPENACVEGPAQYNGKSYTLHLTDNPDQLYDWCGKAPNGKPAKACIKGSDIYAPMPCEEALAHEINHLVGNHWVDRPEVGNF